jgi:hypothetical protein
MSCSFSTTSGDTSTTREESGITYFVAVKGRCYLNTGKPIMFCFLANGNSLTGLVAKCKSKLMELECVKLEKDLEVGNYLSIHTTISKFRCCVFVIEKGKENQYK